MPELLINVAAVSIRSEIREMLQRYVGGILKGIGVVRSLTPEEALESKSDLYLVYTIGPVFKKLSEKIELERIIEVQLFPMTTGIKRIFALPPGSRIGVIAGHSWDAADFLGQLVGIGFRNYLFTTGTPENVSSMVVDYFVIPEEIAPYIKDKEVARNMIVVPRTLDSQSVASIIKEALRIQKDKEARYKPLSER